MRLFLRNLAIKISIGCLVSLSSVIFCAEVIKIDEQLMPSSSVSVCLYAGGNETSDVFVFEKAQKSYWFKGGRLNNTERDAYRTYNDYCIYPGNPPNIRSN